MPKRQPREEKLSGAGRLWRCYPLIYWRECEVCGQEFRREHGWKFLGWWCIPSAFAWRYLCCECAPDKSTALLYKNKWPPPIGGTIRILTEGKVSKGGVGVRPTTPRPTVPPPAQGNARVLRLVK